MQQPAYNLFELAEKGVKLKIKKCPRCGGFIYWAYFAPCLPGERELYRDIVKCFSCSRMFYLAKNGKHPKWIQYPDKKEEINMIIEDTVEEQLQKRGGNQK